MPPRSARGDLTGQIAAGRAADFLLIDLGQPGMTPSWDRHGELVRLASKAQIESVHVHGRRRLWQGWPVDWDARALLTEVREMARQQVARAPSTRWSAWMNDDDGHALDVTLA